MAAERDDAAIASLNIRLRLRQRRVNGELFSIEDEQLELLCEACRHHHQGMTSDELTIGTCWDADRMDLPRVGIQPDPQRMNTQEGHEYARGGPVALQR